jgi:hypothetical protein
MNFRSRAQVLDFCNDIFYKIMSPDLGRVAYDRDAALYYGAKNYDENAKGFKPELLLLDEKDELLSETKNLTKGQIQLVSVGVLLPYVLYVTPVLNLYLEDMIEQVHDMVKNIPEVRMSRYYQPMQWLPHITLGKKLSKEQMQEAFAVMQEQFVPMEVTVSEIGLAKTNPHQDLVRIELND